ncbi:Erf-like ssDNA annealing protein [Flavobacterium phage vB_FspP_elemoC_14-1A]|uniref:Essential recombination function protein n=1 Tax=Flavobacterium phage vB_FspP_elemoC_14-1A TaxID=2743803 RepID=A0A7D7FQB9_9CAUD|nr:Erf-like ssDNA annealing protein [Flavobacterium phage vB_FspP_elemoC_14-1A]QMP84825.1 essential recombination function protein [Flavobacterium phage vB_FspP_elemoC_14-1A]QMP85097.1 essential recombination function protein [Flavobacterium phage vB_FspP_elemoA_2-5C]QMP85365.1 essential recombination function protein [Flavobacterium phage vB_FspP_elemoA_8-9C]
MATAKKTQETLEEKLNLIQTTLNAPKNLYNSFGKYSYRNLEGILAGVKPLLKDTGCTFVLSDDMVEVGGRIYVRSCASISYGGETIESYGWAREEESKKGMDASQLTGSTSSYARKYAANGLFAIDDTIDADGYNTHGKDEVTKPNNSTAPTSKKPTISDLSKVKDALKKDRAATLKMLEKYDITEQQKKELGI